VDFINFIWFLAIILLIFFGGIILIPLALILIVIFGGLAIIVLFVPMMLTILLCANLLQIDPRSTFVMAILVHFGFGAAMEVVEFPLWLDVFVELASYPSGKYIEPFVLGILVFLIFLGPSDWKGYKKIKDFFS